MKNTSNMISEIFSLQIDENINNHEIIDNVHIERIEQDTDMGHVCSINEEHIEQKENKNEEFVVCEIDQLQLANAIRHLVHI